MIVRRELSGGALLAQVLHASGESAAKHALLAGQPLPLDTRGVVLVATKEQLQAAALVLLAMPMPPITVIEETDGPLAGSTTALGFVVNERDREFVKPLLAHLKPWSPKAVL